MRKHRHPFVFHRLLMLAVALLSSLANANAQCPQWTYLGSPGFSGASAYFASAAISPDDMPLVGYSESSGPSGVKKFDGTNWVNVGNPNPTGYLVNHFTTTTLPSEGVTYSAFTDWNFGLRTTIMVQYADNDWQYVGTPGGFSKGPSADKKIVANTWRDIYIVEADQGYADRTIVVHYNEYTGITDTAGAGPVTAAGSDKADIALTSDGDLYIAYPDGAQAGKINVLKYNKVSNTWSSVGTGGFSTGTASNVRIITDNTGTPCVAYNDAGASGQLFVKKYNGTTWVTVGGASVSGGGNAPRMAVDGSNNIYLASVGGTISNQLNVKKFDGSAWSDVGQLSLGKVFKFVNGSDIRWDYGIAICPDGMPFVGFCDNARSNMATGIKLSPAMPAIIGEPNICFGVNTTLTNNAVGGTWSCSNTAVATIGSASGVVTAVSAGTAIISYTTSNCQATMTITVNGTVPAAITGTTTICSGATTTLNSSTTGGSWISSNTAIAIVGSSSGEVMGVSGGTATITYLTGACYRTTTVTVKQTPAGIAGTTSVCAGANSTLSNTVTTGTWSSSNTATGTIGASTGVFSGLAGGTTVVSYTLNSCSASVIVTVNGVGSSISGSSSVCVSGSTTLSIGATGGAWSSSNNTVATVGSSSGVVTGVSSGTTTISYTVGLCGVSKTVSVEAPLTTAITTSSIDGYSVSYDIAGTGVLGYNGDGPATASRVTGVRSIVTDNNGNIYFSDAGNMRVRKIDAAGMMTTVVGTGTYAYTGDGGPATAAGIRTPEGLAMDSYGNLFVADISSHVVRKIDASGIITTVAGTGLSGYNGDGIVATTAKLNNPAGIAIDAAGNLYIAEQANNRVRKVDPSGIITTFAGDGTQGFAGDGGPATAAKFNLPACIYIASSGEIYITDYNNKRIRKVSAAGIIATVMGNGTAVFSGDGGPATAAGIDKPFCVSMDRDGNLYISDIGSSRIRMVNKFGIVSSVTGYGSPTYSTGGLPPANTQLFDPNGLAVDTAGNLLIGDPGYRRIRKVYRDTLLKNGVLNVCAGSSVQLYGAAAGGTWSSNNTSVATVGSSGFVTGMAVGSTVISFSATNSCNSITSIVTVNVTSPAATVTVTGPSTLCTGATATLTSSAAAGAWLSNNGNTATINNTSGVLTAVAAGTATISYFSYGGCGTAITTKVITVNGTPNVGIISGSATICGAGTTTLTESASGGVWSSSNTAVATVGTSGIVTGISSGNVDISYTINNGCFTASTSFSMAIMNVISGNTDICIGSTSTLSTGTFYPVTGMSYGGGYIYYIDGTGTHGYVVSPTVTGGYGNYRWGCYGTPIGGPNSAAIGGGIINTLNIISGCTTEFLVAAQRCNDLVESGYDDWFLPSTGDAQAIYDNRGKINVSSYYSCWTSNEYNSEMGYEFNFPGGQVHTSTKWSYSSVLPVRPFTYTHTGSWSSGNAGVATVNASTGVVTGISGGTAQISYSDGYCTTTKTVTINATGANGTITGSSSACAGSTFTLSNSVTSGSWSSSSPTIADINAATGVVSGTAAGTATISYTITGICGAATKVVTINAAPNAGTISGTTAICLGSPATLSTSGSGGNWSCSNASVATVGTATGILTGVEAGTVGITYAVSNGCGSASASAIITVNPLPVAGTISGISQLCNGTTTTLSTTGTGGIWTSSTPAVAIVSAAGVVSGMSAGTTKVSYTVTNGCGSVTAALVVTVNPSPNAGTISGTLSVCTGASRTLSTSGSGGTWSSNNTGVAAVGSATGIVAGITTGTAGITYSVLNSCGSAATSAVVTVNALADPGTITGTSTVCTGAYTTLSATVPGGAWVNGGDGSVAIVNTAGVVRGVSAGTMMVSYGVPNGCGIAFAQIMITVGTTPDAGTISGSTLICTGTMTTLTTTGSGGNWSSSNTGVATVNTATGIVTGIASGTAIIDYTVASSCATVNATTVVTVNLSPDAGGISGSSTVLTGNTTSLSASAPGGAWEVSNANASITSAGVLTGITNGTTVVSYTLTNSCGTDVATKMVTITNLPGISGSTTVCTGTTTTLSNPVSGGTWNSGTTSVAVVSSTGVVTAYAAGTTIISYIIPGSMVTSVLTVTAAPAITGALQACPSSATTLSSTTSGGTWSSGNTSVATAGVSSGIVAGVASGTAAISYTAPSGCYKVAVVTINGLPGSISGSTALCPGTTSALSNTTPGGLSWTSSTPAVATVGATSGLVNGIASGTTTISYNLGTGCSSTVVVTVNPIPTDITGTLKACPGSTTALANADASGTWSSSNTLVATVSASGIVSGVTQGTTKITYTLPTGCLRSVVVTINANPTAISGAAVACPGSTATLSSSGTGTWTSSNTAVATVGATGIVTGVASGNATIAFTNAAGCSVSTVATINAAPSSVSGTAAVCVGSTSTLSNSALGGTWASANNAYATIGSATGIITGVGAGTTTITYSLGGTCRTTKIVTINAIPGAITGTAAVCAGAATTLTNSTGAGTWSSSNTTVGTIGSISAVGGRFAGIASGTSTVSYTYPNGCSRTIIVTVNPTPNAGTITSSGGFTINTVTPPTSVMLSSTGDAGGAWNSSNTARAIVDASGTVAAVSAGTAIITYTVTQGSCTARATQIISIVAARAGFIAGDNQPANITFYPNPSDGSITISGTIAGEAGTALTAEVTDMLGQAVQRITLPVTDNAVSTQVSLDPSLARGSYLLVIHTPGNKTILRFTLK